MPDFGRRKCIERQAALFVPYVQEGDAVLDIMCGSGEVAAALAARTGCQAWGADLWPHLRCNLPYAPMQREDFTGFADWAFDAALLRGVLHHLPHALQPVLLGESLRVARRVLLLEPAAGFAAHLADWAQNVVRLQRRPLPMTQRSFDEWRSLAAGAGMILDEERIARKALGSWSVWQLLHLQSREKEDALAGK